MSSRLNSLQQNSERLLRDDASKAMDALLTLVSGIEWLYNVTERQNAILGTCRDSQMTRTAMQIRSSFAVDCKGQSRVVHNHFKYLHDKSRSLMEMYAELTTDLTHEITVAKGRIKRLHEMLQVAEQLRQGSEAQRQSLIDQKATAEAHVRTAEETRRAAERKQEGMESARVVRNIFTLGLGEVFDLFDLNEEIEDAERVIASTRRNVQQCEESIRNADAGLSCIKDEVQRLNDLRSCVQEQEGVLDNTVSQGEGIRARTIDLTNKALDVSVYVGKLAARSEMLRMNFTAEEFARGVLDFGRCMTMEGRVGGLLESHPGRLQGTLEMIANSGAGVTEGRSDCNIDDML
ncbi:hypothetical protein F5I97DRAFT_1929696 [Phlebopus sp. FC_14]|nr:hypothetical protein F5I97DRAFT_1929696 [Phlebopus sp. FC_14]